MESENQNGADQNFGIKTQSQSNYQGMVSRKCLLNKNDREAKEFASEKDQELQEEKIVEMQWSKKIMKEIQMHLYLTLYFIENVSR